MNSTPAKIATLIAVISVGAALVLMGVRTYYAISLAEPLQGMTRGVEYEPLFSIWKYMAGESVYTDQTRIPFTASFYNWLSYAFYGEIARLSLMIFSLGDAWLPTIARLTTLAGAATGAAVAHLSFVATLDIREPPLKVLSAAFALFLFLGPLTGFFAIAAGPDLWPMVFTAAAVFLFIRHYETRPLAAILWVCLFSYASWAFKQNFVYIPATVGLFLLLRRDWKMAIVLTIIMGTAGGLTLLAGGSAYARLLYFAGSHMVLAGDFFVRNFTNFMVKFLPVMAALIAGLGALALSPEARKAIQGKLTGLPVLALPFLGVLVCAIEALPTSAIVNAAENHYFTLAYFMTFSSLILVVWLVRETRLSGAVFVVLALGWLGNLAATGTVLAGWKGVLSVRPQHDRLMAVKSCLNDLGNPVFVSESYLALPWMIPSGQPFVVHNGYAKDKAAGIKKEGGGIGGLIDRGYFATVIINKESRGRFDGSDLARYRPRPVPCGSFVIYDRRPVTSGNAS